MPGNCPSCGRSVADGEYFCDGCGEALFPDWFSDRGAPHAESSSYPSRRIAASVQDEGRPLTLAPSEPAAGYGYAPEYMPVRQMPIAPPREKKSIHWGMICTVLVITAALVGGLALFFTLMTPRINFSPPPGWGDAPERDCREITDQIEENFPEMELEAMYMREDNTYDFITITSREAEPYTEISETSDVADIERYIEELEDLSYDPNDYVNPFDFKRYLEDLEPVPLECGLVGLYQATSFGGSFSWESLFIRKRDKVFWVYYFKGILGETPSPEMQHFIDTISFD